MLDPAVFAQRAREILRPEVYSYLAGGSGAETTLADNVAAWSRIRLRPHVLTGAGDANPATTVLGTPVASPVLVAPTAYHALAHPAAERATAAGAAAAGTVCVVSTRCSAPLDEVAAAAGPWWFQVYVMRDRDLTRDLVRRAAGLGASALVLTGDTPVIGRGDRDRALVLPGRARSAVAALGDVDERAMEQAPDASFADLEELVRCSGLPVLVKGVLRGDDALACLDAGAAGVVVSNHGGRQLDGSVATADALPEVVACVGGRAEVLVDGGIRNGVDVLRALALGATATLVGRPVLWGLAVAGADGVRAVLDDLRADVARALTLAGARTCAAIDRSILTNC